MLTVAGGDPVCQAARSQVVLSHGRLTGLRHITARLHWGHFGQDVPSGQAAPVVRWPFPGGWVTLGEIQEAVDL